MLHTTRLHGHEPPEASDDSSHGERQLSGEFSARFRSFLNLKHSFERSNGVWNMSNLSVGSQNFHGESDLAQALGTYKEHDVESL